MASANDMKSANATYGSFINLIKWSTPIIIVITFVVLALIAD
jgi:hypothetical protein